MSYKYMLLDSRGAPVAQGISEDGPEKNVWQLRIARGDIKRVLGHEYISLVGTSEQFPAMEGRIVQCRDDLISVELRRSGLFLRPEAGGERGSRDCNPSYSGAAGAQGKNFTGAALSGADSPLFSGICRYAPGGGKYDL